MRLGIPHMVLVGVSARKLFGILQLIKRLSNNASWTKIILAFHFGLTKLSAIDKIERAVQKARAVERIKGTANQLFTKAIKVIDKADDYNTLKKVEIDYIEQLNQVTKDSQAQPLKENIPVLTILCDEQIAKPGMLTRLEAFVDLLERKRQARINSRQ